MKVVIGDNSSLMRDRIKILLRNLNHNYEVFEAEDGVEALQLIGEKEPDLAIIDIRMAGMNGIEVLKKIRELKLKTRVCILTNYSYPQYRKRCLEEGADFFFSSKSEDFEEIKVIISDLENNENKG
ncbi:MAG: response regulator transcription factor [Bacteroidales bacterium]